MKQSLVLLCGLLCDETFWTDIPQRLCGVADVSVVSFRGFPRYAQWPSMCWQSPRSVLRWQDTRWAAV